MSLYIKDRCEVLAEYVVKNGATVRATAKEFGISKSTVHKDLTQKLKSVNLNMYQQAKEILNKNKEQRHLRGGEATKQKYLERKAKR